MYDGGARGGSEGGLVVQVWSPGDGYAGTGCYSPGRCLPFRGFLLGSGVVNGYGVRGGLIAGGFCIILVIVDGRMMFL